MHSHCCYGGVAGMQNGVPKPSSMAVHSVKKLVSLPPTCLFQIFSRPDCFPDHKLGFPNPSWTVLVIKIPSNTPRESAALGTSPCLSFRPNRDFAFTTEYVLPCVLFNQPSLVHNSRAFPRLDNLALLTIYRGVFTSRNGRFR